MRILLIYVFLSLSWHLFSQEKRYILLIDTLAMPDAYYGFSPFVDSSGNLFFGEKVSGKLIYHGENEGYISESFIIKERENLYIPISKNHDLLEVSISSTWKYDTIHINRISFFTRYFQDTAETCIYQYLKTDTGLVYLPEKTKCSSKIQKPDYKKQLTRVIINGRAYMVTPPQKKLSGTLISDGCGDKKKHIRVNVHSETREYRGVFTLALKE